MTAPAKTRKQWAVEIIAAHKQSVEGILQMGRSLIAAKKALAAGTFLSMIEHDLPFDASTAQRLMKIARDPRIRKAAQRAVLPMAWGTLCELSKLPDAEFKQAVSSGAINPRMTRDDAKTIRVKVTEYEQPLLPKNYKITPGKQTVVTKQTIANPVYVTKEEVARIELLTTAIETLSRFCGSFSTAAIAADNPVWPRVIDRIGKEGFHEIHEIVVMLQAVYAHCETERKVTGGIEEDTADDQADDTNPRLH